MSLEYSKTLVTSIARLTLRPSSVSLQRISLRVCSTLLPIINKSRLNKIPDTRPILDSVDGATAPSNTAGPESNLDFQISYPIIYPQNSILFQTDDPVYEANYSFPGFLNNFLDAIDGSYCSSNAFGETGNSPLDPPYPDPAAGGYKGKLQCGVYSMSFTSLSFAAFPST